MKVALIIEHFDATRGGAEHLTVWIANELARRGHEVHIVCHDVTSRINKYRQATLRASHDAELSSRAHPPPEVSHPGIHIHRLRGMRVNTSLGFRRFGMRARRWCRLHRPDVVHSLSVAFPGDIYHACAGVYAAIQAQAAVSRPTTAAAAWKRIFQRLSSKQRLLLAMERRAALGLAGKRTRGMNGPQRIISLCAMMTAEFQRFYEIDSAKVVELASPRAEMNGSAAWSAAKAAEERAWFRGHYRLSADDRVALFVGHDFRRKGLRYAIEAVAQVKKPWKLLVVGLGKAREYVELAETLGIGDSQGTNARVLFVGPTREMERVYAAADALLLPTFYDPIGLVVLEAFGHGLPVISTEFLGASELVRKHRAGTIVPSPRSVVEMAAALDGLPEAGTTERTRLAERSREASAGVSPERYMESLLAVYETVRKR